MELRALLIPLIFLAVGSLTAQDTVRLQVLSYEWTTTHRPINFSWPGSSSTSCNSNASIQGNAYANGSFNAYGTTNGSCQTTFNPPINQTIDVEKPVVYILAETDSSRMILTCTRNVRWSQCEALNPGTFFARNLNGHFEVSAVSKGKSIWTRYEIVNQVAIVRQAQAMTPTVKADSLPSSDDVSRVATYRNNCNSGDMQGCINLGTMYRMGWGIAKDLTQANGLFKQACDAGNVDGCKNYDAAAPLPIAHDAPIIAREVPAYVAGPQASQAALPISEGTAAAPQTGVQTSLLINSAPAGADITVDGSFVGDTPSAINITTGVHEVTVTKTGFKGWHRSLTVTGGSIHLNAELQRTASK